MTTTAIDHTYKYTFSSEYASQFEGTDRGRLALATDSSVLQKTPKKATLGTFFIQTESKCTCPWYAKHQGERGPCKHVLAVQLETEREG